MSADTETRLSEADLAQMEARCQQTTEGPWTAKLFMFDTLQLSAADGVSALYATPEDAAFIAAARTDLPRLITAYRALLRLKEEYKADAIGLSGEVQRLTTEREGLREWLTKWLADNQDFIRRKHPTGESYATLTAENRTISGVAPITANQQNACANVADWTRPRRWLF